MPFLANTAINPALGTGSLLTWNLLVVASAVLILSAVISVYRNRESMTILQCIIWLAAIILAPLMGSIVWLVFGRRLHRTNRLHRNNAAPRIAPASASADRLG